MWELADLVDSCYRHHQMADALTVFFLKLGVQSEVQFFFYGPEFVCFEGNRSLMTRNKYTPFKMVSYIK